MYQGTLQMRFILLRLRWSTHVSGQSANTHYIAATKAVNTRIRALCKYALYCSDQMGQYTYQGTLQTRFILQRLRWSTHVSGHSAKTLYIAATKVVNTRIRTLCEYALYCGDKCGQQLYETQSNESTVVFVIALATPARTQMAQLYSRNVRVR